MKIKGRGINDVTLLFKSTTIVMTLVIDLLFIDITESDSQSRLNRLKMPDEQRLLKNILRDYDTASRPVYNASHSVTVKFGLTLAQIADMDEVNQVMTTNVWLEQEWVDERLVWSPDNYNGLSILRIPCGRIWLPDIVLYNSADDFTEGFMQSKAMVTHKGTVFWAPPAKLRSSCKIDITYFPFDDQKCIMKFGSWTYDGGQVDIINRSAEVDLANYVYSGEWSLLGIEVIRNEKFYACCKTPYPDVTFRFVIRRKILYYLFNIIFPCLWLSILSLLEFWLPPNSGEKVTLGITVLLAFSVFMLLIAESMPATSEFVPLIGIYLTMTMAMTSISIVLTVCVLQLHYVGPTTKPVPKCIRVFMFSVIGKLFCQSSLIKRYNIYLQGRRKQEYKLSSFVNVNGNISREFSPNNHISYQVNQTELNIEKFELQKNTGDDLHEHLNILITKQNKEDEYQTIIAEWRLVAHILDRSLFWTFFFISLFSSLGILVFRPLLKPNP